MATSSAVKRKRGQLEVLSRDIERVLTVKHRETIWRLDIWPFVVLHLTVIAAALNFAFRFQWFEFNVASYGLALCVLLHVLAWLFTTWSVKFKAFVSSFVVADIDDADGCFVEPAKNSGSTKPELVVLERRVLRQGIHETVELGFEFRKQRFILDAQTKAVSKLEYPVQETFETYCNWMGQTTQHKALAAHDKYGMNRFYVPLPPFSDLLREQLTAPFFCFQVFCVVLWMLDEYWYYSLFTLFMLVSFECTVVTQRLRALKELRSMQTAKQKVQVYRCGQWELLPGEALLVGDVISIGRPSGGDASAEEEVVPADCLVLAGTCIVEEAVLTGESTPQWKMSIADLDKAERLDMKMHKNHVLFSGTRILQNTGDPSARIGTPDGGCLAAVVRTGFETSQGQLMRTIMFSSETVTANSLEAGVFILFLLMFAIAAAHYVLENGLKDPTRDRFKLILNCIMIVTSVIPPELPMELTMAVNTSLLALTKKRVFCTEPFRIPFAGKVDVCCFDKTGTLTSDHLLLEEVVGPGKGSKTDLVMATCQSLLQIDGGDLVGDPLEKASLEACGWHFANEVATSPDKHQVATILHRFHFNSNLKRMSVLVRCSSGRGGASRLEAVMKGAPEVVKQFLVDVPSHYDSLYKSYAAQGARVIALATKTLSPDTDASSLKGMSRDEVEAGMSWAGFAVFQCPLKEDSAPALKELSDSSHQLMMITGDAPLTACFAASKVHIVTRDVLVLSHREEETGQSHGADKTGPRLHHDSEYFWASPDEATLLPFSRSSDNIISLAFQYDLALSGDALAYVEAIGLAPLVIPLCQVFARVSPEQKELVLVTLKAAGRITLMCGDGTNDVGGLKAAHVGVALLSASEAVQKLMKAKAEAKAESLKAAAAGAGAGPAALQAAGSGGAAAGPSSNGTLAAAGAGAALEAKKGKGAQMLDDMVKAGKPISPAMQKMAKWLDDMEKQGGMDMDMPMVKPGDASMASPFTAKSNSVMPCTDIIKQGRCTLVTTVQMFKILGLLCLSTAYSLSVMYLEGVKLSDAQATLTGILTAGMFFFISQAKPLEKLSPTRPHPSIFNPYFFISLLGQFAVQISVLIYMYRVAHREMPPIHRLSTESEFKPNLVNSVCYLVEAALQLSTFGVNYVGHPFNSSIHENKGMYACIFYMFIFLGVVMWDFIPGLAELFGLVEIPRHIRFQVMFLCLGAFGVNYFLEHTLRGLFPAKKPPLKGYMLHEKRLKQLGLITTQKPKLE